MDLDLHYAVRVVDREGSRSIGWDQARGIGTDRAGTSHDQRRLSTYSAA